MQVLFVGWQISLPDSRQVAITSDSTAVLSGVPQGLLFLIYVDDLASLSISVGSQISVYADDLLLFQAVSTQSAYCVLRNDVAAIENCSSSLNFNISKCKYMGKERQQLLLPQYF